MLGYQQYSPFEQNMYRPMPGSASNLYPGRAMIPNFQNDMMLMKRYPPSGSIPATLPMNGMILLQL